MLDTWLVGKDSFTAEKQEHSGTETDRADQNQAAPFERDVRPGWLIYETGLDVAFDM